MATYPSPAWIRDPYFNEIEVNKEMIYRSLHHLKEFNQQQKLALRATSLSSNPFTNDLIARCSEEYVMKDTNITPPTTIKPNLLEI